MKAYHRNRIGFLVTQGLCQSINIRSDDAVNVINAVKSIAIINDRKRCV